MIRHPRGQGTLALLLATLLVSGCRTENLDHCVHKAEDANAWCSVNHSGTPFCSPCQATHNGCVAEAPSLEQCAIITPEAETTSASPSTSSTGASSTSG